MSDEKFLEDGEEPAGRDSGPQAVRHPLRQALRRARQHEAERADVIVDLREAEIARLELLQDALSDVFEDVPEDTDLLECRLISGSQPRLWIDVLGQVVMGRDKRTYRFLKDTRYGRQVMLETTNLDEMASRVTDYVAHRLIERERALDSERHGELPPVARPDVPQPAKTSAAPASRRPGIWTSLVIFLLGIAVGAAGLFAIGMELTSR